MNRKDFPKIHFYDQDFVDIYNKTWNWLGDFWIDPKSGEPSADGYFVYPEDKQYVLNQFDSIFSSFFLVYSNRNYPANQNLDYLYARQEKNGAIRWKYDLKKNKPIVEKSNPEGIGLPLFAWAEFNLYHKSANKRRVKEIVPVLQKYIEWIDANFKKPNGLYSVPYCATGMFNSPRDKAYYPVDFNAAMAINATHMAALGDILNDKELSFQYKKMYFSLKTRINSMMWNPKTKFYHDLDKNEEILPQKTIAGFWPLLAEIPNADKADELIEHLSNPKTFGTDHPFPTLSADSPEFKESGEGYRGSVFPAMNFMVIKGLEKYQRYDLARECSIRHLYYILEGLAPNDSKNKGDLFEAYLPTKEGKAALRGKPNFPRVRYLQAVGLSTIALMIENVIGLLISLPRKTVDWIIPNLEIMGIENLSLKRNLITILSNKSTRGWEIQMESEKLYYFTINILDQKKKTLPIPSGKCSMLIDKL
ncbi:MAG: MGH1-like glycoside hydrolase domain-containing protein [Treponema sp.]